MKSNTKARAVAREAAARAINTYPSVIKMAKEFGVHRVTIYGWKENGVPIKKCLLVEKLTGVPKEQLHPEFFG